MQAPRQADRSEWAKNVDSAGPGHITLFHQPLFDIRQTVRSSVDVGTGLLQQGNGDLLGEPGMLPFGGKGSGVLKLPGEPWEEFLDLDLWHLCRLLARLT